MKQKYLTSLFMAGALLMGCSATPVEETSPVEPTENTESSTQEKEPIKTPSSTESSKEEKPVEEKPVEEKPKEEESTIMSKSELVYMMDATLKSSFGSDSTFYYNTEYGWFQADVVYEGAAEIAVLASFNSELKSDWNELVVDSMVELNLSMKNVLEGSGYGDEPMVLMVLNDQNTEKTLVTIMDGVVISNAVSGV